MLLSQFQIVSSALLFCVTSQTLGSAKEVGPVYYTLIA